LNLNDEKNPDFSPLLENFQAESKRHDFLRNILIPEHKNVTTMIRSAIMFLAIALIAGIFGFGVIAGSGAVIAQTIFFIAVVMLLVSLLSSPPASRSIDS
jgi:uncharacterized membrane protein YtjA (UPF0391 family)